MHFFMDTCFDDSSQAWGLLSTIILLNKNIGSIKLYFFKLLICLKIVVRVIWSIGRIIVNIDKILIAAKNWGSEKFMKMHNCKICDLLFKRPQKAKLLTFCH